MGLLDRMSRVASANLDALLGRLEDPAQALDLSVRDMEETLRAARHEVVQSVAAEKQLRKKGEQLAQDVARWESRAELAVRAGDDDLAREALRHRRRLTAERDRVEQLRAEQRGQALAMRDGLARMEAKLREIEATKGTLAVRLEQARGGGGAEGLAAGAGKGAFQELRRMEDRIEGVEAALAAEREIEQVLAGDAGPTGLGPAELEARFRALESGRGAAATAEGVEEELSALKARVRVKP